MWQYVNLEINKLKMHPKGMPTLKKLFTKKKFTGTRRKKCYLRFYTARIWMYFQILAVCRKIIIILWAILIFKFQNGWSLVTRIIQRHICQFPNRLNKPISGLNVCAVFITWTREILLYREASSYNWFLPYLYSW